MGGDEFKTIFAAIWHDEIVTKANERTNERVDVTDVL